MGDTRNNSMRNTKRFGELRFFVTEEDAMEESAYLVGKREDELPGVTAARRTRSTGGQTFRLDTNHMGRLGIGLVAGVINSAGTRSGRPDAANPVPDGEAWTVAIAAVEALKPSYLGTVIHNFIFTAWACTSLLEELVVLDERGARVRRPSPRRQTFPTRTSARWTHSGSR